jgi:hypothetical protein
MKERKQSGRSKEFRQLRGWFLTCKLAVFLPSLALGTHAFTTEYRTAIL